MIRVLIDTNVIVSGMLLNRGLPFAVLDAWYEGRFQLIVSDLQIDEIAHALTRPKIVGRSGFGIEAAHAVLRRIEHEAERVSLRGAVSPVTVRDPDDELLVIAAINGNANYLVSGDKDLLVLADDSRLGSLQIVSPRAFLVELARLTVNER